MRISSSLQKNESVLSSFVAQFLSASVAFHIMTHVIGISDDQR
jgi:hypothetical protein